MKLQNCWRTYLLLPRNRAIFSFDISQSLSLCLFLLLFQEKSISNLLIGLIIYSFFSFYISSSCKSLFNSITVEPIFRTIPLHHYHIINSPWHHALVYNSPQISHHFSLLSLLETGSPLFVNSDRTELMVAWALLQIYEDKKSPPPLPPPAVAAAVTITTY